MNTRAVMDTHILLRQHYRCPICREIIERDHDEAKQVQARMLAETFNVWGQLAEPTGFALAGA